MLSRREKLVVRYTLLMERNGNDGRIAASTYYDEFDKDELREVREMIKGKKKQSRPQKLRR